MNLIFDHPIIAEINALYRRLGVAVGKAKAARLSAGYDSDVYRREWSECQSIHDVIAETEKRREIIEAELLRSQEKEAEFRASLPDAPQETETHYRVRLIETGRYLEPEMKRDGGMWIYPVTDSQVRAFPRAKAQAVAATWSHMTGDAAVELEPVE